MIKVIKMSDNEMLTLIANYLGYEVYGMRDGNFIVDYGGGMRGSWNPLADDGDALKLAVDLNIDIHFTESLVDCGIPIVKGNCSYAATRYAIVRAAVEFANRRCLI